MSCSPDVISLSGPEEDACLSLLLSKSLLASAGRVVEKVRGCGARGVAVLRLTREQMAGAERRSKTLREVLAKAKGAAWAILEAIMMLLKMR